MFVALTALVASALLGLAVGLLFRVWANVVVAPIIAFGSAIALAVQGFRLTEGVLITLACLVASQAAYVAGSFLALRTDVTDALTDDVPDDQPGEAREQGIGNQHEQERGQQPPRPSPPQT
jgi:hypothetical protein